MGLPGLLNSTRTTMSAAATSPHVTRIARQAVQLQLVIARERQLPRPGHVVERDGPVRLNGYPMTGLTCILTLVGFSVLFDYRNSRLNLHCYRKSIHVVARDCQPRRAGHIVAHDGPAGLTNCSTKTTLLPAATNASVTKTAIQ